MKFLFENMRKYFRFELKILKISNFENIKTIKLSKLKISNP